MLQYHHIGRMFAQWPGLFFTEDLHTRQRCAKTHAAAHLRSLWGRIGTGAVMHQITAEKAAQLVFKYPLLIFEQQLPVGAGQPFPCCADQRQPLRVCLSQCFIGHCSSNSPSTCRKP